jgi:hypothetical protein
MLMEVFQLQHILICLFISKDKRSDGFSGQSPSHGGATHRHMKYREQIVVLNYG